MNKDAKPNRLIDSRSPYLLQHAHNPVQWHPWDPQALQQALSEDKPILLSIGYSACHWCHVMEKESFENQDIAALMNEHFVCIKVDREERPDIDQLYMDAVQMMGLQGGWPLNVFLTPQKKPFYGGTYFPPANWAQVLNGVSRAFRENRQKLEESAEEFTQNLQSDELEKYGLLNKVSHDFKDESSAEMLAKLAKRFDLKWGGTQKAPKFPMPCLWNFVLEYHALNPEEEKALEGLLVSLDKMALGGIYDQVGGGFARYSVDGEWMVPHFEKMLYDNGQLLSLYAKAYRLTRKPLYKRVIQECISFLTRDLKSPSGGYYAALDADSEGEEGKYYVWKFEDLENLAGDHWNLIQGLYTISKEGNWEKGNNILHTRIPEEKLASLHKMDLEELYKIRNQFNQKVLEQRQKRIAPGLDNKILAGWNGLLLSGLCESYLALEEAHYLELALELGVFLKNEMTHQEGMIRCHGKEGQQVPAFLEDYAAVIQGFIKLYQISGQEKWLQLADQQTNICLNHFRDSKSPYFFYTDHRSEPLLARKKEIFDNVIPASNSIMAHNLLDLSVVLDKESYAHQAQEMLSSLTKLLEKEPQYLANWASLYLRFSKPTAEVAILGKAAKEKMLALCQNYWPNTLLGISEKESQLPLLQGKSDLSGKSTIFVCQNRSCQAPTSEVEEAARQLAEMIT